jgi:hypothetical protein
MNVLYELLKVSFIIRIELLPRSLKNRVGIAPGAAVLNPGEQVLSNTIITTLLSIVLLDTLLIGEASILLLGNRGLLDRSGLGLRVGLQLSLNLGINELGQFLLLLLFFGLL